MFVSMQYRRVCFLLFVLIACVGLDCSGVFHVTLVVFVFRLFCVLD